jgi:RNA polymerase sigma-70 factor (sigma-E family)
VTEPPEVAAPTAGDDVATDEPAVVIMSFDAFFQRERAAMVRLATSLIDIPARAEEVVQDAFVKTYLAWKRIDQPGAYLRRSVINGCHSELRRRRVMRRHAETASPGVAAGDDTYLLDALAGLAPKRRIALTLRFYADLSEAEIAAAMGVRPGTVKSMISRGLADLRKVVER